MSFKSRKVYIPNRIEIKCNPSKLGSIVDTLVTAGYSCTVNIDPDRVYIIEFDYSDISFGGLIPMWVTEDESYSISSDREGSDSYESDT